MAPKWSDLNEVAADENPLIDLTLRLGPPVNNQAANINHVLSNPTVPSSVAGNGENSSILLAMNPAPTATVAAPVHQFPEAVLALPAPFNRLGVKRCSACNTEDTPIWRRGPSGRKTLCNACGINFRNQNSAN